MKTISAEELDKKFDECEDISAYFDLEKATRVNLKQKRVTLELPIWMVNALDKEAKYLGVSRQAIIKVWLADKLRDK